MTPAEVMARELHGLLKTDTTMQTVAAQLAALSAAGFAVVPREPTEGMLTAGSDGAMCFGTPLTRTENAYRAMLAAAEAQQKEPPR